MRTLILCIDRDNDFGRKTGVKTPILGRRNNLDAAVSLATTDPEDSDANSLFAAIKIYDELKKKNKNVEIATICGDKELGKKADHRIAYQLGEVLSITKPSKAIVVSDGVGDELVLPLLRKKVKVEKVHRVIVKQHEGIESAFYVILKGLSDERLQIRLLIPLSLILIIYGIFTTTGMGTPQNIGSGTITLALGTYLLLISMHVRERILSFYEELKKGLASAKFSLFTSLSSIIIVIIGAIYAYKITVSTPLPTTAEALLFLISMFLWWVIPAILVRGGGFVLDSYIRTRKVNWRVLPYTFSITTIIFIINGTLITIRYILGYIEQSFETILFYAGFNYIASLIIGVMSAVLYYRYVPHPTSEKTSSGG